MSGRLRRRRWVWGALALTVIGSIAGLAEQSRAKAAPLDPALIVTAARRPLDVDILETGRVVPREKVDIKSKVAGQVEAVLVEEGMAVAKGQTLLVLDPTDYARDLARADADIAQANAALDFARVRLNRAERSIAEGLIARAELEQAAHEAKTKAVAVRGASVARDVAKDRLRYTKIVSPISGTLIARGIEPGEVVVPGVQSTFEGKPLLTIADLSVLLVRINLNQIDVAKVTVGRKASLTLDALPGKTYAATVTRVAPASTKLPGKEQEVFPVEAQLEAPDGAVLPGMTADVRVRLDRKDDALVVPLEAIAKEGAKSFVSRVHGDAKRAERTEKVEVTTGLRSDREIEIVSGLEEGARVIVRPPSAAENEKKL